MEIIANGAASELEQRLRQLRPEMLTTESLTLEEIFVATLKREHEPQAMSAAVR